MSQRLNYSKNSGNDSVDFLGNKQQRTDPQSFWGDKQSQPAKGWQVSPEKQVGDMEEYEHVDNLPSKSTAKRTPQSKVFSFNDPGFNSDDIQKLQQAIKGGGEGAGGSMLPPPPPPTTTSKDHFRREVPAPSIMMTAEPYQSNALRLLFVHQNSTNSVSSASFASEQESENKSRKTSFSRISKTSPNNI